MICTYRGGYLYSLTLLSDGGFLPAMTQVTELRDTY